MIVSPLGDRPPSASLYYGADALNTLKKLPTASVHCVVTSPPYWSLRDYGVKGQLGAEDSPEAYVDRMVRIFKEVHRVLRDEGTVWLNLGDTYCSTAPGTCGAPFPASGAWEGVSEGSRNVRKRFRHQTPQGMKPKDLVGIPWMVAFALRSSGWYLRSDIIWHKPACMPESVVDRPTKTHEYIFLLAKRDRYFYDIDSIREPHSSGTLGVNTGVPGRRDEGHEGSTKNDVLGDAHIGPGVNRPANYYGHPLGRNKRSVWSVATASYPGAHFAVWPEALVEIMIKAGTSEVGCCPICGTPWKRASKDRVGHGWERACGCPEHEPIPCVVLDPFSGSGTTGQVAMRMRRSFIGLDINPEYLPLAKARITNMEDPQKPVDEGPGVLDLMGDD